MKLTKEHFDVLTWAVANGRFLGFPAGSNLWPLTVLAEISVDGERVDELLREGMLATMKIDETVQGERSENHDIAPDLEFDHEVFITDLGRSALTQTDGEGKPK